MWQSDREEPVEENWCEAKVVRIKDEEKQEEVVYALPAGSSEEPGVLEVGMEVPPEEKEKEQVVKEIREGVAGLRMKKVTKERLLAVLEKR